MVGKQTKRRGAARETSGRSKTSIASFLSIAGSAEKREAAASLGLASHLYASFGCPFGSSGRGSGRSGCSGGGDGTRSREDVHGAAPATLCVDRILVHLHHGVANGPAPPLVAEEVFATAAAVAAPYQVAAERAAVTHEASAVITHARLGDADGAACYT